ncbi:unnamed protein product [Danaus chrysippus]|uniref:(African queen) hypothetical protein n=1 Tax=Danaus chrysippus TaxID=151541 RepID=A0A8J2VY31_9NEOP|nr:unnamed protein product [Danaus chrysippus]
MKSEKQMFENSDKQNNSAPAQWKLKDLKNTAGRDSSSTVCTMIGRAGDIEESPGARTWDILIEGTAWKEKSYYKESSNQSVQCDVQVLSLIRSEVGVTPRGAIRRLLCPPAGIPAAVTSLRRYPHNLQI